MMNELNMREVNDDGTASDNVVTKIFSNQPAIQPVGFKTKDIVSKIKNESWEFKKDVDINPFLYEALPGQYALNKDAIIQVRTIQVNLKFVTETVNKILATDDSGLERITVVYFSKDYIERGKIIHEGGSTKLIGGSPGLSGKPTQEEQADFLDRYPQINSATIANWIAYHDGIGGRQATDRIWSPAELKAKVLSYNDLIDYDDFVKIGATSVKGFDGEMLGRLVKDCTVARLKAEEEGRPFHKKAIVTIYASTKAQVNYIDTPKKREVIENCMEEYRKTIQFDVIKIEFLRYKV